MNSLLVFSLLCLATANADVDKEVGFDPKNLHLNVHTVVARIRSLKQVPLNTVKTLELAARFTPQVKNDSKAEFKQFFNFIARYQKSYADNSTLTNKFSNFKSSLARIRVASKRHVRAEFEVNDLADYSHEEFLRYYTGSQPDESAWYAARNATTTPTRAKRASDSFDWRDKGIIGEVRNQGTCGCCYAFATVEAAQGAYAVKTGKRITASVQQVAACSSSVGNHYCHGGLPARTMQYIADKGLVLESEYPYASVSGSQPSCSFSASPKRYIRSVKYLGMSESDIRSALKTYGPLHAAMDASDIQFYKRGVLTNSRSGRINHSVTLVGYGTDGGTPYWLVKNSWSPRWGEKGYFRIKRGSNTLNIESLVMAGVA